MSKPSFEVNVHQCKDLKSVELIGKQDPYVVVTVGKESWKTKVHEAGGSNPVFNQAYIFNDVTAKLEVNFTVFDKEVLADRAIARLDSTVEALCKNTGPQWHQLIDKDNFSKIAGDIQLTCKFVDPNAPKPAAPAQQVQQQTVQAQQPQVVYVQQPQVVMAQQPQVVYVQQPQVVMQQPQVVMAQQPQVVVAQQPQVVVAQQPQVVVAPTPVVQTPVVAQPAPVVAPVATNTMTSTTTEQKSGTVKANVKWGQLAGGAIRIAVGAKNHLVCANTLDEIYESRDGGRNWSKLPGAACEVALGVDGDLWVINKSEQIWRWNGSAWVQMSGAAVKISVANKKNIACVNKAGQIFKWDEGSQSWHLVDGAANRVAIGVDGTMWAVNSEKQIWRRTPSSGWTLISGSAVEVACHDHDTAWVVNNLGQIYQWGGSGWHLQEGEGHVIACNNNTVAICNTNSHHMFTSSI